MPELPEVEAVCRRLQERAAGSVITEAFIARPQTTKPFPRSRVIRGVAGRRIESVGRRAKHALIRLSGGMTLRVHLGMTGNLWVDDPSNRPPNARAWFTLDDGREIVFDDPRLLGRIELLNAAGLAALNSRLGIEPLSTLFTSAYLQDAAAKSRKPAKIFLLDQKAVVGLGNIWAAESLFAARVNPTIPMHSLGRRKLAGLHSAIVDVLSRALESAYQEYSAPRMTPESEGFGVAVYNRLGEPCLRCGSKIARIWQGGRSTYLCPRCQR